MNLNINIRFVYYIMLYYLYKFKPNSALFLKLCTFYSMILFQIILLQKLILI